MAKSLACIQAEDVEGLLDNANKDIALNTRTAAFFRYKNNAL